MAAPKDDCKDSGTFKVLYATLYLNSFYFDMLSEEDGSDGTISSVEDQGCKNMHIFLA